jgi:hypothetical protein
MVKSSIVWFGSVFVYSSNSILMFVQEIIPFILPTSTFHSVLAECSGKTQYITPIQCTRISVVFAVCIS